MERLFVAALLGAACFAHTLPAQQASADSSASVVRTDVPSRRVKDLPPLPKGKSTILGGSINGVDPVRDQFELNIYGSKPMKILFDERTQVFRDGKKIGLRDFGPAAHASVQTTLDGAKVFAVSVHILSSEPGGNYQGRVLNYDAERGVLTLTSSGNGQPFQVAVSSQTSFKRLGQTAFSKIESGTHDLMPGSLVNVKFAADNHGHGVAQEISVLAAPGATFIFAGTVTELDVHTGSLVLVDPRTNQSYRIAFDPTRDPANRLRAGQRVRIEADYDGSHYVATQISIE